jgi:hypothetical protein
MLKFLKKFQPRKNFAKFSIIKYFGATNLLEKDIVKETGSQIVEFKPYESNIKRAEELLKVANLDIMNYSVKQTIEVLLISGMYKKFDYILLQKIEKKLINVLRDLDHDDLAKVIFSFSNLNYNSNKLNFMIERVLINRFQNMPESAFTAIIKSLKNYRGLFISKGLYLAIKGYILKNLNTLTADQSTEVFLVVTKLLTKYDTYSDSQDDLIARLYDTVMKNIAQVNINKVASVYFVLYGYTAAHKPQVLNNIDVKFNPLFMDLLGEKSSDLLPKKLYQIVLANHFNDFIEKEIIHNMNELLERKVSDSLALFTPDEVNTIILILNHRNYNVGNKELIEEINKQFIEICIKDINDMNTNELILYLHSLLTLRQVLKDTDIVSNTIDFFEQNLLEKRFASLDETSIASLLDLLHHFGGVEHSFKSLSVDKLTPQLLKILSFKTTNEITTKLSNDYYLITILLLDLQYRDIKFWQQFLKYFNLITSKSDSGIKIEKLNKIIEILNKEIPELRFTPYQTIAKS